MAKKTKNGTDLSASDGQAGKNGGGDE